MEDWEWEVADESRIDEFLEAYFEGDFDDSERVCLMEMIIQCFADRFDERSGQADEDPRWNDLIRALNTHLRLHSRTINYWAGHSEYTCVAEPLRRHFCTN